VNNELSKNAALAIQSLQEQNEKLENELISIKLAQEVAFTLFKEGSVAAENIESTLIKLSEKSKEQLELVKEATSLHRNTQFDFVFGKLSDDYTENGSLDPTEKFTNFLLGTY